LFTGYLSGLGDWLPVSVRNLLDLVEFCLLVACVTGLYYYLPNTRVDWRHALIGGVAVAVGLELAKKVLGLYLAQMPTYSAIYGAFSAVPILLVWIYVAWVVVLLGAVVTASLPEIGRQAKRQADGPGWSFIEHRHAQTVLDTLQELKWLGRLEQSNNQTESAWVLLVDMSVTPVEPLMQKLCLHPSDATELFWQKTQLTHLKLVDVIKI
jgi:membrane protein